MHRGRKIRKIFLFGIIITMLIAGGCKKSASKKEKENEAFTFVEKMGAGINIGNALDCYGSEPYEDVTDYETYWHNEKIKPSLFTFIKECGFDTVRIPITWQDHLDENGVIDEAWLNHVKEVVDWAMAADLYVIINAHHDSFYIPSDENQDNALNMTNVVWTQIAECFKEYNNHLLFEGFNEPRLIGTDEEWKDGTEEARAIINKLNAEFVNVIRSTGGKNKKRYLLITGYRGGISEGILRSMEWSEDKYLLLSIHAYTPYEFASKRNGTDKWDENDEASTWDIKELFRIIDNFIEEKNIPVIITEFGSVDKNNEEAREAWLSYYMKLARERKVSCIWWDNNYPAAEKEGYSLIDRKNEEVVYPELVNILTKGQ